MPKRKRSRKSKKGGVAKKHKSTFADKVTNVAARAAGTTLGFIKGNIPGAIGGYAVGAMAAKYANNKRRKSKINKTRYFTNTTSHNDLTVHNLGYIQMGKRYSPPPSTIRHQIMEKSNLVINSPYGSMGARTVHQGQQCIDYLDEIMHRRWFVADTFDGRFGRSNLSSDLYKFALDYSYTFTGYQGEVARTYNQNKVYVDDVTLQYGFLSMTTVPQTVDVYFVTPKNDVAENPLTKLELAVLYEGNGQDYGQTAQTSIQTSRTSGKEDLNSWGTSPFEHSQFRKSYKLVKKLTMTLNPGDQRHFKLKIFYGKYIDRQTYDNQRVEDHLRGLTITPLVVARAGLVGIKPTSTEPAATEAYEVAFGKPKVGISTIMKVNLRACWAPRIQPLRRVHEGLLINTSETTQEINDEDDVEPIKSN